MFMCTSSLYDQITCDTSCCNINGFKIDLLVVFLCGLKKMRSLPLTNVELFQQFSFFKVLVSSTVLISLSFLCKMPAQSDEN